MRTESGLSGSMTVALLVLLVVLIFYGRQLKAEQDNGIVVDEPKQFSYVQLEAMIAKLQEQLASISPVDGGKIQERIGATSSQQRRSSQFSLNAQEIGTPAVETTLEANDEGDLVPTSSTVSRSAVDPSIPSLGDSAAGPAGPVGPAASQVLAEQVQLQYELYNLNLLLRRAVSDLHYDDPDDGTSQPGTRVLALVGVTVTLNPSLEHKKKAAFVELTMRAKNASRRPSLVALMPEKKTFNTLASTTSSKGFGGAALVGVVSLGFAGKWESENLYFFQDVDTVALRGEPNSDGSLTFGWQFRPVLGQRIIEPGQRQLFAVISLDERDVTEEKEFPYEFEAETYWRHYSTKKRAPWGGRLDEWGLESPWERPLYNSAKLHRSFQPVVESITSRTINDEEMLVRVTARNVYRGAKVILGDRTLTEDDGLTHRSGGPLEFTVPIRDVLNNRMRIAGADYGFSVSLEVPSAREQRSPCSAAKPPGFTKLRIKPSPDRKGKVHDVVVTVKVRGDDFAAKDSLLYGRSAFLMFAGETYEIPWDRWRQESGDYAPWL